MTNLCVSLWLAKRLKEVWWNKRTEFSWRWWQIMKPRVEYVGKTNLHIHKGNIPAPTAQELLDVLPTRIKIQEDWRYWLLSIQKRDSEEEPISYWVCYHNESLEGVYKGICSWETLAESLWELVIRCVENWYLDLNDM